MTQPVTGSPCVVRTLRQSLPSVVASGPTTNSTVRGGRERSFWALVRGSARRLTLSPAVLPTATYSGSGVGVGGTGVSVGGLVGTGEGRGASGEAVAADGVLAGVARASMPNS